MLSRLLVCLYLVGIVFGELCVFPRDHLIRDLKNGSTVDVVVMHQSLVYVYTDKFDCSGCIQTINFCYQPNINFNLLMIIEIRKSGGGGIDGKYNVSVNSSRDMTNCERYTLGHDYCCVEQTLKQPLVVDKQDSYFALSIPNTANLLLRSNWTVVNGTQENLHGHPLANSIVYKPLFYFTINTSDKDCITTPDESAQTTNTNRSSKSSTLDDGDLSSQTNTATNAGAVGGGVIGVILFIILLVVSMVVVVVVCIKKKERKVIVKRVGEDSGGFSNNIYGAAGIDKMTVSSVTQDSNTYEGDTGTQKHQYECIKDLPSKIDEGTQYTYVTPESTGQVLDTSYAAVGAEINAGKRPSLHNEAEDIYEAPANNETSLYAQFEKIKVETIPRNSIRTTECLGSGQFGNVNKGTWQNPTSTLDVAIKTLKSPAKEEDKVKFLQEGAIMGQFKHPNVVRLHGIVREQETVLLVIELLAKENLREHLLTLRPEEGRGVDENFKHTLLSYCRQVVSGLAYLAKKGFVHRDMAARNILLSEDYETCKIADFGMSRDLADETYYISRGGKIPVKWTAPEALHYKKYSTASDVWSFGCLMYEIWSLGHKPFEPHSNAQAIRMVDGGYRLPPPPGCPRAIYQLMINCWNPTASERPSADTASQTLSKSDPVLLKWEEADKPAGVPQALQLGAPLISTTLLYSDLQTAYLPNNTTNYDYEDPED